MLDASFVFINVFIINQVKMCDQSELDKFNDDPRTACKYGGKCYQQNPEHHKTYKHPPKQEEKMPDNQKKRSPVRNWNHDNNNPTKKRKIQDYFKKITKPGQEGSNSSSTYTKARPIETTSTQCNNNHDDKESQKPSPGSSRMDTSEELTNLSKYEENKKFIKRKFLVEMPDDFFKFWDFCKSLKTDNPSNALQSVGLHLVGPYDVLSGNFRTSGRNFTVDDYLIHWRYYYDPPEFQTVLKGNDTTGYHIGYFRDSPEELPSVMASNHGCKDGTFKIVGDNIFAAVNSYLEDLLLTGDPFKKTQANKYQAEIQKWTKEFNLDLSKRSVTVKKRNAKVVSKTFNGIGLVVPLEKRTKLGYRELAVSDKELKSILDKLQEASPEKKALYLSELQPVITYASIAADECDFGTNIELGWDIIAHGIDELNSTAMRALVTSYKLLQRESFAKISEAHLNNRKKGCRLSIL